MPTQRGYGTCDFHGVNLGGRTPEIAWIPSFQYIRKNDRSGNPRRLTLIPFPAFC
jgi:hypothetical protein